MIEVHGRRGTFVKLAKFLLLIRMPSKGARALTSLQSMIAMRCSTAFCVLHALLGNNKVVWVAVKPFDERVIELAENARGKHRAKTDFSHGYLWAPKGGSRRECARDDNFLIHLCLR